MSNKQKNKIIKYIKLLLKIGYPSVRQQKLYNLKFAILRTFLLQHVTILVYFAWLGPDNIFARAWQNIFIFVTIVKTIQIYLLIY